MVRPKVGGGEETRILDALILRDRREAEVLPDHPLRAKYPAAEGWLLMRDIRRRLKERGHRGKEGGWLLGRDHWKTTVYKIPRLLASLETLGLVERQAGPYVKKGTNRQLLIYRLRADTRGWKALARRYHEAGKLIGFLDTFSAQQSTAGRRLLRAYQVFLLDADPFISGLAATMDEAGDAALELAKLTPGLFADYLRSPVAVKTRIGCLVEGLRKVSAYNPGVVYNAILAGELYQQGRLGAMAFPIGGLKQIFQQLALIEQLKDTEVDGTGEDDD